LSDHVGSRECGSKYPEVETSIQRWKYGRSITNENPDLYVGNDYIVGAYFGVWPY
jgi:hypothetical protein